jgi:glycosyltransferase involved in cell wall biosynthesis
MRSYLVRRGSELLSLHRHALVVSHDYGWFYNGIAAAALAARTGVPYVSEIHHVPGFPRAADLRERFDRAVARAYVRWARSRARAFRVVNQEEMPALLASWGVPRERIAVLPSLYIDLEVFAPARTRSAPQQDVLFVGRMVRNKGLDRIADALAILKRRGLPHSALFVGRGPLQVSLRARLEAAGLAPDARFIEWVESPADLAEIYRKSRVVVCASTCEGGPRVTVEGMACGTPAVSTRVGVMGEILRTGENGALVGFDALSLADGLALVLENEERRRAMGARARETAARFEQRAMIRNYAEGLKRLAG